MAAWTRSDLMLPDPRAEIIRNALLLERMSRTLGAEADRRFSLLSADFAALIVRTDPLAPRAAVHRAERMRKLLAALRELLGPAYADVLRLVRAGDAARDVAGLAHVGRDQGAWTVRLLRTMAGPAARLSPSPLTLNGAKALVDGMPIRGLTLAEWFKGQQEGTERRVTAAIRHGAALGETTDQLVRRVRGRATGTRGVYVGGVMDTTTREARGLIRTAVTDIATVAQLGTLRENEDVAPEYEIVATLDARTSDVCKAMDRRRYPVANETAPRPPFHNLCRSIIVPVIAWKALGLPEPPPGQRASANGPVPDDWTYERWLREQPASVQRDVLGPGRAKLFAEGRLSMRDLVRSDGRRVRLSELEARSGIL